MARGLPLPDPWRGMLDQLLRSDRWSTFFAGQPHFLPRVPQLVQMARGLPLPDPRRGRWVQLTSIRGWTPTIKTSDRYPMLLIWDTHFDWMIMLTLIFPDQTSTLPLSLYTKYTHWILFLSHEGSNTTVYHMFIWILDLCFVFASSLDIRSCVWVKYNFADLELYHIYWILGLVSWEGQLQLSGFGLVSYFCIGY